MDQTSVLLYQDPNPHNRGYDFFNNAITLLRRDLRPIVSPQLMTGLRLLLDSKQSMQNIIDSFDDVNFKRDVLKNATPLGIMNVFINSMIEEIKKAPPRAEVRANDPAALAAKQEDIDLLRYRKILESDRSELQGRVGMPAYKIPKEKYNGNIPEFDKLGLDDQDPDDVNFFDGSYHRLDFEIAAQSLVNTVMKLSKFDSTHVQKYVRDACAGNTVCGQTYVDRVTGEIKNEYIYPEDFYFIPSDTEDGHNDIAKAWLRSVTIAEFLGRVGNNFDWKKDWPYLIWAINYCNNTKYTGFMRSGYMYDCVGDPEKMARAGIGEDWVSNCCDWNMAYRYKVWMGYTEWLCPEVTDSYLKRKGADDDERIPIPLDFKFKEKQRGRKKKADEGKVEYDENEYEKESWYQWQLYGSYYLATTSTSQYLFNYGKVYHTLLEGANDEYARYTLWSFRNQGKSMAEIAYPIVEAINFAWYRLMWILYKAKPEEEQFLINEVLEISKGLQQQFNQSGTNQIAPSISSILDQVIQYQRQKTIRIRAYPRIDGREIGQLPPLKNENRGIDPLSAFMQSFVLFGQELIAQQIGWNPMRSGANPPARESFKTEQSTLQSSYNSTGYVGRMIQAIKNQMGTLAILYAQDIAKFKDSVPYKWLLNQIGDELTKSIGVLDKIAAHRFSIFVEDINDVMDKELIKQAAMIALQEKQINFEQFFIISQTKDYKRAAQLLSYLQRRAEKRLRMQALQDMKIQDEMAEAAHQRQMEEMAFERETKIAVAKLDASAFTASAQINKTAKIDTQEIKSVTDVNKQTAKTQGDIAKEREKANLEKQAPLQ